MTQWKHYALLLAAAVLLVFSCSDENDDPDAGDGNQIGGGNAPTRDQINEDAICHEVDQGINEVTSRVMLLEDMSTSMEDPVQEGMGGGDTKWNTAVAAITSMVNTYETSIEFGLDLFPIGTGSSNQQASCEVGSSVLVDVGYNNADSIIQTMNDEHAAQGTRATPLFLAMSNFNDATYAPGFTNGESGGYLVVVSDGRDTCGTEGQFDQNGGASPDELRAVTSALLDQGIQTFVIGFGGGVDPDQLNAIAEAGGTQFDEYFDAADEAELNQALDSIGQAVIVSCQYQLGNISADADRNLTNIFLDGQGLARGEDCSGDADWTWGNDEMTVIQFCENACALLESGDVDQLEVIIMCSAEDVIVV